MTTYGRVLSGMSGDVLERPVHVLVLSELSRERLRLLTTHSQDAVVCRQHRAIHHQHLLIIVVGSDVTNTSSPLVYRFKYTRISCRWQTSTMCCIKANVLQTSKVDTQCEKLVTKLS